jgi:hypothetical protein
MKTRTAGEYPNYGARLYSEGLQSREKREAESQKQRQERVDPELTFRPKISTAAQKLRRPVPGAPWDRMLSQAEEVWWW